MDYTGKELKFFDDDYEIIYSSDFNIYSNEFKIIGIDTDEKVKATLIFKFTEDNTKRVSVSTDGDEKTQTAYIKLNNFKNSLGVASSKRMPIIEYNNGTTLYLSVHAKSINTSLPFLKLSITLYKK